VAETRWNPWRALRSRHHLQLVWATLEGAEGLFDPPGFIWLDDRLGRRHRNAVLAHELIHDERRGGCDLAGMPASWSAVVARDEAAVDDEVARRLVPVGELADYCRGLVGLGLGVTAADVAEHFDVTDTVAERSVALLLATDRY